MSRETTDNEIQRTEEVNGTWQTSHVHQGKLELRQELPVITVTWRASKYSVGELHLSRIL